MPCDIPAIMICADLSMSLKSTHSDRNLKFISILMIDRWLRDRRLEAHRWRDRAVTAHCSLLASSQAQLSHLFLDGITLDQSCPCSMAAKLPSLSAIASQAAMLKASC